MKRVLTILMVMALSLCAASAFAADDSWERVKNAGQLAVGLDDAFPPMGFRDDNGTLVGFDIETAEEVGKRLGVKIAWHPTEWKGVINSLYAKKYDCIWNGMTITAERQKKVAFSKPYLIDGQIATVRMDEKAIKTFEALEGKKIGVQAGSPALEAAKKLPKPAAEIREYDTNPKAFLDLEADRLDSVVVDNVTGRFYMASRPGEFRALPGYITKEAFGVAFRMEDAALRGMVQKAIDEMVADGTLGKISRKWFGEDVTNPAKW
ncbi:transporter substrate-binding domain-containing protein [Pseudodesulfovibrio sp. JC047]|uniref:amino acid ABC transporter substrate-binding protein n=1 Tax=Pseudodesulfovibrio sp. JC047 TaxID=2683199 RepID=UPI0013D588E8|nr:amino acid ABC transporter substrate-binding protein [Pseudodesulfovibrio sp. JC047]NDV18476.1 transporter substrate-binding domain-containing protein [Pseudodesulfovibrio sp. JC047]